jgi:hypothetical protein
VWCGVARRGLVNGANGELLSSKVAIILTAGMGEFMAVAQSMEIYLAISTIKTEGLSLNK